MLEHVVAEDHVELAVLEGHGRNVSLDHMWRVRVEVGSDVPAWGLPKSSFNRLLRSEMEQHLRSMKKIRFVAQVQPKESVSAQ
jgi:hypothetical protein